MYIQHPETDFFYRELHQPGKLMGLGLTTGCYGTRCPFSLGGMDMFWRVLKIFTYLTH